MRKLRIFFRLLIPCFLTIPAVLYGNTPAVEIEILLNTRVVTYAQASRFVLEAADVLATNSQEEAFNYAKQRGWLPRNVAAGDQAQLNHICRLLTRSFDVGGGLMYLLTKNSHYAYRELVYMNVLQGRTSPRMLVSGEWLVFYVNRLLAREDVQALADARVEAYRQAAARREALAAEIAEVIQAQAMTDITVEATNEGVMITLSNIMFEADSAALPRSEMAKIYEIAGILRAIPGIKILIAGHTTNIGAEDYLRALSRDRAQSVADYLIFLETFEAANITIVGYGGGRPIGDNSTAAGMAANRRVELIILE